MTVNFQYVDVDVSETLSAFTEEKFTKKLATKYEFLIGATVYFKIDEKQAIETGKICNIDWSLPYHVFLQLPMSETLKQLCAKPLTIWSANRC